MKLPKLLFRNKLDDGSAISIAALDQALDVETDRFESQALRLAKDFGRRGATLDLAGYRRERRKMAANSALTAEMAVSRGREYSAEMRRFAPMDRVEEFKMARRHEFLQRMLAWHLSGFGIGEEDSRQLLRRPASEIRAAIAGRRSRRRLDAAWFDAAISQFEELRNLYVEGALYLVMGTMHRYRGLGVDAADLIQEGNASLFQAIDGFDWRRDVRFRTYAQYWVQQAVLKVLYNQSRTVRVPIWVQKVLGKIRRVQEAGRRDGRELTNAELAAKLDLPIAKIEWVLATRRRAVSLDAEIGNDDGTSLGQLLPDDSLEPVPESISPGNLMATLADAMADLPDRERHILRSRFGLDGAEPRTLGEIATEYGITPERVRQLQNAALQRMQKPGKLKLLQAFVE